MLPCGFFLVHRKNRKETLPRDDTARAARKGNAAEGIKDFASSGHEHVQSSSRTGVTSVGCAAEGRGRTPWEKRARDIVERVMKAIGWHLRSFRQDTDIFKHRTKGWE